MDSISFIVDNIKRKLKELNPYKSAGVDRLNYILRILKELSKELSTSLSIVFTKSFIEGQLP